MSIQKPYHRFYRPFVGDKIIRLQNYGYVTVRDYAEQAELYIRSFNMILNSSHLRGEKGV